MSFCSVLYFLAGLWIPSGLWSLAMPESRAKTRKLPAGDRAFRPSHVPTVVPRSPHPTRDLPATSYEETSLVGLDTPSQVSASRYASEEAGKTADELQRLLEREEMELELEEAERKRQDELLERERRVVDDRRFAKDAELRRQRRSTEASGYLSEDADKAFRPVGGAMESTSAVPTLPSLGVTGVAGGMPPTSDGSYAGMVGGFPLTSGLGVAPGAGSALDMSVVLANLFAQQAERDRLDRQERRVDRALERDRMAELLRVNRDREDEVRTSREQRAEKRELKVDLLKGLGGYKEGAHLVGYLAKFERVMTDCDLPKESWPERLTAHMPERLSTRMAQLRSRGADYSEIKAELLLAVGENAQAYGYKLFDGDFEKIKGYSPSQLTDWVDRVCRGVFQGASSVEDCVVKLALAYTRHFLPHDGRAFLRGRVINSMRDLCVCVEEWMASRQEGNFYRPRVSGGGSGSSGISRGGFQRSSQERNSVSSRSSNGFQFTCYKCNEKGHRSFECPKSGIGGRSSEPRKIVCYHCQKEGHIAPECPDKKQQPNKKPGIPRKVSQLRAGKGSSKNTVEGKVNGVKCKILIDSGADIAFVPRTLIGHDVNECGEVKVSGVYGGADTFSSTNVEFELAGEKVYKLAVIDEMSTEKLCIIPFQLCNANECALFSRALHGANVNVLTRAQVSDERELDVNEVEIVNELNGSLDEENVEEESANDDLRDCPVVLPSGEVGDADSTQETRESVVEESASGVSEDVSSPGGEGNNVSEDISDCVPRKFGDLQNCTNMSDSTSCEIIKCIGEFSVGKDGEKFREAVREDKSLQTWRSLADRKERGFRWKNGVLVKEMIVDWEERAEVIVVPKSYRERILVLSHDRCGHLGSDKVLRALSKRFLWPGMAKEVGGYCRGCDTCQRRSRHVPRRAPAVERPILSEPFESVAVDLVGPLPKGKGGARYLLTYVCMATRWPEAIPLRSITAKSVAEALLEIFSRTGIPELVLTDQGSQFVGKVMSNLCSLLGIERVRTSPYHPQSNGVVERMHGTLKAVLGKSIENEKDWVGLVPLALFVLRQMPHADSGMSPFDLTYGFRVRTPLDVLYSCLLDEERVSSCVKGRECEWAMLLAERLDMVRDQAALKEAVAKGGRMAYLNKGTKLRKFAKGEQVLYRVPGRTSKLSDSWEGPYVVLEVIGKVNYRIGKENARKHSKVVHVNCIKKYVEGYSVKRLDVVLDEVQETRCELKGVCDGYNEDELKSLMVEFGDLFSEVPGKTEVVAISIDTGGERPVSQAPYSVPLGIRGKVRSEIENLERLGIIERCESPWSSPLVPVRKPNGDGRLCVDYRRVNAITVREPYFIPSFQEMVELVGRGKVLSKIDLAKGFHQVGVSEADRDKTAFVCPFGKFRFVRMPFGLTNAPAVFQRCMDIVLKDCVSCSRVYIDDVLVVSNSWEEHVRDLRKVFKALQDAGLRCKREKCDFGKRKLHFLGHWIGDGELAVPEARVKAIADYPQPKNRRQLRSFLGLLSYYRSFISGFHRYSSVLSPHTSGPPAEPLAWTAGMIQAFEGLRVSLCSYVKLCVPCVSDDFVLETDACASGVGAVLSVCRDDVLKPVGFFSRQLRGAQTRYSAQELEGLAVLESVNHFSFYLYGRRFKIITDHKGLASMKLGRQKNRRLHGWAMKLADYDYDIEYRAGKENCVADCLSRGFRECEDEERAEVDGVSEDGEDVRVSEESDSHFFRGGGDVGSRSRSPHS